MQVLQTLQTLQAERTEGPASELPAVGANDVTSF